MGALLCKIPYLREKCDDSAPCMAFGSVGVSWFDVNRKLVMYTCAVISFVAIILQIVPVITLSTNNQTVIDTHWTFGHGSHDVDVYVGLRKVVVTHDGDTHSTMWSDADCTADYCDQCRRACARSSTVAIVALLTSLPQVTTDIVRAVPTSDLNCQKITGVLTGLIGTIGVLAALGVYLDGCYHNLPDSIELDTTLESDMDWQLGPGFICLVAATCIRPVNFFAHLLTPTPSHKRRSFTESLLRTSSRL